LIGPKGNCRFSKDARGQEKYPRSSRCIEKTAVKSWGYVAGTVRRGGTANYDGHRTALQNIRQLQNIIGAQRHGACLVPESFVTVPL
jgi:hypothetical protein